MKKTNKMERLWNLSEEDSQKAHEMIGICFEKSKEILNAPMVEKENSMRTDGKIVAINLAFIGRAMSAESGKLQAMTVVGERQTESKKEFKEFIKENLPHFLMLKMLKEKSEKK